MNTIYLVRHGENIANLTRQFSCKHVDYSLTPKGILQAQQTGEFFKDKQIDEIYASPMKRARETASIIGQALDLPVTIIEKFREVNVGDLEFQPPTDENWDLHHRIAAGWHNGQPDVSFPQGENYFGLLKRMQDGLLEATRDKEGKNIVIVGHSGIFTFTINDICPGADMEALRRQGSHNCSVTEIELDINAGKPVGQLKGWALCTHLSGEATQLVQVAPPEAEQK